MTDREVALALIQADPSHTVPRSFVVDVLTALHATGNAVADGRIRVAKHSRLTQLFTVEYDENNVPHISFDTQRIARSAVAALRSPTKGLAFKLGGTTKQRVHGISVLELVKHNPFIPPTTTYHACTMHGSTDLDLVGAALSRGRPVLLVGASGSGKHALIDHLANRSRHARLRAPIHLGTTMADMLGRFVPIRREGAIWIDGPLVTAARNGYWLVLDGLNRANPEILDMLHHVFDHEPIVLAERGEVLSAHHEFRIFATSHAVDALGPATLQRMRRINLGEPDGATLLRDAGIPNEVAERVLQSAKERRALGRSVSPRGLIAAAEAVVDGVPVEEAFHREG